MKLGGVRNGERFVYVDTFKGAILVSFREFYNDAEGQLKPGNKGTQLEWANISFVPILLFAFC